jgi:hypothetical protein
MGSTLETVRHPGCAATAMGEATHKGGRLMTPEEIKARALAWERKAEPRDLWGGLFLLSGSLAALIYFPTRGLPMESDVRMLLGLLILFTGFAFLRFIRAEQTLRRARGLKPGVWRSIVLFMALGSALTLFFALFMPVVFIAVHMLAAIGVPCALGIAIYSHYK